MNDIFFDVQRGLPRQGPGSDESTLKALSLCNPLPERPAILDIGCGPGMQTVALAKATGGSLTAVDTSAEFLAELKQRAELNGVVDRIKIIEADMNDLPFAKGSFDLIWSEGAAYIMGFANALKAWRSLLKPSGTIAVSELVWLRPNPPAEPAAFFAAEYPAMSNVAAVEQLVRESGYQPVAHFTLSNQDWWQHYYTPLEAKLPALFEKYRGNETALQIVQATEREIDMYRRFAEWYGYEFFIARRAG